MSAIFYKPILNGLMVQLSVNHTTLAGANRFRWVKLNLYLYDENMCAYILALWWACTGKYLEIMDTGALRRSDMDGWKLYYNICYFDICSQMKHSASKSSLASDSVTSLLCIGVPKTHGDVIKQKRFPHYWPFSEEATGDQWIHFRGPVARKAIVSSYGISCVASLNNLTKTIKSLIL